jgi:phage terminase small subunit
MVMHQKRNGRISAAERATPVVATEPQEILTPEALSSGAQDVYQLIMGSVAEDHFADSDWPLLFHFCEGSALANTVITDLQKDPTNQKLLSVWTQCMKVLGSLSLRLRLSPQARRARATPEKPLDWATQFRLSQQAR